MDHSAEWRQFPVNPRQHRVQSGGVCNIREFDPHRDTSLLQRGDRFPSVRVGCPPTVQHDRSRASVREPACHDTTDSAETAGHEIGSILSQASPHQRRCREHDLADMPGIAHEFHRQASLEEWPSAVDNWPDLASLEALHHAPQRVPRLLRVVLLEHV